LAAIALLLSVAMPATTAAGRAAVYRLHLTGDQEATADCAPPDVCGDPDATGRMIVIVNQARDTVCFLTRWSDIDGTVVAAHIHLAPVGVAGGVVVPLFAGQFESDDMLRGCVPANGLSDELVANPSAYYVNIHSTVFPPGAIRAQLG
jgi:hypothetical protein